MYFCYLDESGTPELGAQTSHFVLLGVAIPATAWYDKDARVDRIKAKYGIKNAELHTGYIARNLPEQNKIPDFAKMDAVKRRLAVQSVRDQELIKAAALRSTDKVKALKKLYAKTRDYIHLDQAQRTQLLREVADEVGNWTDIRLFADALDKTKVAPNTVVFDFAFEQVVARFHTFLVTRESIRQKYLATHASNRTKGADNYGLLIEDNNETHSKRLTEMMRRFHSGGTWWTHIHRIIETPLFVDSSLTSMVQVADLCAYATRRFFENGETDLFDRIFSRFDRRGSKVVGIRHYTGANPCTCKVCLAHGRRTPPPKTKPVS
jgi:hypothetical protein